jgi:hypothetical protein
MAPSVKHTRGLSEAPCQEDTQAARLASLTNGVAGVLSAAVLSIHAIGQAYARLAGITAKSGVEQIDRLLSNQGVDLLALQRRWVEFVVGARKEIVVAMDWTEFEKDDHSTLCIYLLTNHGRATPLLWETVQKSELLGRRACAGRAAARMAGPDRRGGAARRPWVRRLEAQRAAHDAGLGLRDPLPRQHPPRDRRR